MATILAAVDGTDRADAAARWAVGLLGLGHRWELVRVVSHEARPTDALTRLDPPVIDDHFVQEERRAAERHGLDLAGDLGISGEVRIETGEPGPALCAVAGLLSADLLVVASHGRGPLGRALLGSVSTYVSQHAPCPVLVHRPAAEVHS